MRTVLGYYKKYIPIILLIFGLLFGQAMCELALPNYMSGIINNGIVKSDMAYIRHIGLEMIVIAAFCTAFSITANLFSSLTAAKAARDIRKDLFSKVTRFSTSEMEKFSTASLITRSTNDVQMVQQTTMMMRLMFFSPIMGIGAVIMALRTSVSLAWTVGLALICVLGLMVFSFFVIFPRFRVMQEKLDRVNLLMKERLSGTLVIRAFRMEQYEEERFDDANKDLTGLYIFVNKAMAFMMPTMTFIMSGSGVLIVWVAAGLVDAGSLSIGAMMAYIQYAMHVIMSFMFVTMIFIMLPRAAVSARRIGEVLDTEISIKDPESPETLTGTDDHTGADNRNIKGEIKFSNVSFAYPDAEEEVIKDISFTAEPGKTTAIIGGTGSGKSTIVRLIPRFYDVTEGSISFDGRDIRSVSQRELRAAIGLVPQKGVLFSGTIADNLRYGNENAADEDLAKAAQVAQAMDFINDKPLGFEEEISQGGANVSGGQKQRLCIARALVKKPAVYVFDDSFSALDFATDKALRKALKEYAAGSTIIIVAQRINTIMDADRIIVLDEGRIAGKGTHEELMRTCGIYKEIALSQLSEEELEYAGASDKSVSQSQTRPQSQSGVQSGSAANNPEENQAKQPSEKHFADIENLKHDNNEEGGGAGV